MHYIVNGKTNSPPDFFAHSKGQEVAVLTAGNCSLGFPSSDVNSEAQCVRDLQSIKLQSHLLSEEFQHLIIRETNLVLDVVIC